MDSDERPIYFEEVELGAPRRTEAYEVTREEVISFARKWDPQPFHLDDAAAAESIFGSLTACFAHIFAIHSHLMNSRRPKLALLAGLGFREALLSRPARPGDRLHIEYAAVSKRESRTKPDRGIVETQFRLLNQRGEEVMTMTGRAMVARRPATLADDTGEASA